MRNSGFRGRNPVFSLVTGTDGNRIRIFPIIDNLPTVKQVF
jgi:hypothetical protein